VEKTSWDGVSYISPLKPFNGGSKIDRVLMKNWLEHYKSLGIRVLIKTRSDGTFEIWVNEEDNIRMWNSPCMVGDCYIRPPDPMFGLVRGME